MLGVSINILGPRGEIWIFGLVRQPPWSTHHSESAETANIPTSSALVELCTNTKSQGKIRGVCIQSPPPQIHEIRHNASCRWPDLGNKEELVNVYEFLV